MRKPKKAVAVAKLNELIERIEGLTKIRYDAPEFSKWERAAELALRNIFGEEAKNVDEFTSIGYSPTVVTVGAGGAQYQNAYLRGLMSARALLESMVEEIQEYWLEDDNVPASAELPPASKIKVESKNVFIVHGRDDGTKETIARYVGNLGYAPIILHEQPSEGRTVVEKFEANADVCFVIVLMTPDDMGAISGETDLKPRARQNVVFEFGYFVGRLSRRRVCALTKGDVEIPSDYAGVVYIPIDSAGAWRLLLVREMKAAGLSVDANKVI